MKKVRVVYKTDITKHSNIIYSHTIYKIKTNDDKTLKLKSRIAPQGNQDRIKMDMRSDCNLCFPCGLIISLSIASLKCVRVRKADVKSAFPQNDQAKRDVYVILPRECTRKQHYWLLLTAAYDLGNSNAKCQSQSYNVLKELGLTQCQVIPQLFYVKHNGKPVLLAANGQETWY